MMSFLSSRGEYIQKNSMPSTSASSVQKSFKYDVFLSFRGEDTRKSFVDHLYHALKLKSIDTYRDDEEIKKGKRIDEELIGSIEDSRFYIIVFSKNYASSSWCLEELAKIIECHKTNEHTAYPVFFDVEPTEVRKQSGAVGKAFALHEEKECAGKWREALTYAADLAGWELKNTFDGHEALLIQKVVKEISLELRYIDLSVDSKLVGMKERVQVVLSHLETDIDDVRMIGIKGIGGGGKTTLSKVVFDQISDLYEGSCFVENFRESTKVHGLKSLQKQVLSDVLNDPNIDVGRVPDLRRMMQKKMKYSKVLVVLDDVDHIDQLEALAGETTWFKPGSRVIITTREVQVLVAHGVPENLILDVNLLSHEEASCLFNRYAFGREVPGHGFEKLTREFVRYAAGLPLTIKVLGSLLCGQDELEWEDELERLKTIPLMETQQVLELSYKSLENDRKEIFLDVACLLKGWEKERAIRALESRGFHARSGLKVLEQKSLITISHMGHLSMHDHIEEMGKNIVRRLHLDEPHKHSRLWIEEEVKDVLIEDKGTEATRCLKVWNVDSLVLMKGLRKMKELRLLVYERVSFQSLLTDEAGSYIGEDSLYLPDSLQYILWYGYPFSCLPKGFKADNLVGIELVRSKIYQLWAVSERKVLKKLRFIRLNSCGLKTLDMRMFLNLERLELDNCEDLVELHMPVKSFTLKSVILRNCPLKTLDLARAGKLETLTVELCQELEEVLIPVEGFKLKFLKLSECKLKTLDLTQAHNLETLILNICPCLAELSMPVESSKLKFLSLSECQLKTLDLTQTQNLETLTFNICHYLVELHMPIESFKLNFLSLYECSLKTLDLTQAVNLETLTVNVCRYLVELRMPVESFKLKFLSLHGWQLKTLDLTQARNLEKLTVSACHDLVELCMPVESLKLKHFRLHKCQLKTLDLARAEKLKTLTVQKCRDLVEFRMPVENFKLESLILHECPLKTLDLTHAQNLETLSVNICHYLVELQMPFKSLKLKSLFLRECPLKTLDLAQAEELLTLTVELCQDLEKLCMPVESFNLKSLFLHECLLKTLDLTRAQKLETLTVEICPDLVVLHMPVESLRLKHLHIEKSKLKTLNLTQAQNLNTLHVVDCKHLEELRMAVNSKLESLNLCHSKLSTLDLAGAQNLKTLIVKECDDMVELHMPVISLMLKDLYLECSKLKTLNLTSALNLTSLDLKECRELEELKMPVENIEFDVPKKPIIENFDDCDIIFEYHDDTEELSAPVETLNHKVLSLQCLKLKALNLTSNLKLKRLSLKECEELEELYIRSDNYVFLEFLEICHSKLRTLDLAGAENLEKLIVERCDDMVKLHMPIESLKLKDLSVQCSKLKTLNLTSTLNLKRLSLIECEALEELHMHPHNPFYLEFLEICHSKLTTLNLAGAENLQNIIIDKCDDMVELHMASEYRVLEDLSLQCSKLKILNLTSTPKLKRLSLKECEALEELHMHPHNHFYLEFLEIFHSKLRFLNLAGAENLQKLIIEKCDDMVELHLASECLMLEDLSLQCSKLKSVNLTSTPNLKSLYLKECEELEEIHMPVENLELKFLEICHSKLRTLDLAGAEMLENLIVENCDDMVELHMPAEGLMLEDLSLQCPKLKTLNLGASPSLKRLVLGCLNDCLQINSSDCVRFTPLLVNQGSPMVLGELHLTTRSLGTECPWHLDTTLHGLRFECVYKEPLSSWVGNPEKLIIFDIRTCTNLATFMESIFGLQCLRRLTLEGSIPEVPQQLDQLEGLEELNLLSTSIEQLPDSICMLRHLKVLWLESCVLLDQLPEGVGRLEFLEELHLTHCTALRDIPNSITEMKSLRCFHLTDCVLVEKLPKGIGRLKCLEELNIEGTSIDDLPQSIFQLKGLLIIGSRWQLESTGITSVKKNSNYSSLGYI